MEEAKEEIRARLAIEDVVGQYIELKRAGRSFKGRSPWGVDKTPSFMVSPEKGIWHDFSSNKGGDIFSFVMEMEGIGFREALEKLAAQAGVELKKYSKGDKKIAQQKERLREINALACKYYQVCLAKNQHVLKYVFYRRNLNKKTVENFMIGYAPKSGKALVNFLKKRGFKTQDIVDAGLTNRFGSDLFQGRMMIPLMDTMGRVIAFTGRIIDDKLENAPKYLNTPETLLYNKGRHVFGFSQAKEEIRKQDFVVVVEGNMDVISSHQAGVQQAVATAGTAMTEMHLKTFARLTKDIRLAYDGDAAGVAAAERAIALASKMGIYLSVIDHYYGCKDADELIQKDAALWQQSVQNYTPAIKWLLGKYEEKYDLREEKGFCKYADMAKLLISQINPGDTALREKYELMAAETLGISLEAFRERNIANKKAPRKRKAIALSQSVAPSRAEKYLACLVQLEKIDVEKLLALPELKAAGFGRQDLNGSNFNRGELELIFEQEFSKLDEAKLEQVAKDLARSFLKEQQQKQREALVNQIAEAEQRGDEAAVQAALKNLEKLTNKFSWRD